LVIRKTDTLHGKGVAGASFRYLDCVIETHPEVYDPAEDSFLLVEEIPVTSQDTVLELGTGCGLFSLAAALKGAKVVCTDVNPYAVQLARRNNEQNHHRLKGTFEVRQGDLFFPISGKERFSVIVFNPPYLPTTKKEKHGSWLDVATDGGADGLQLTKRFLHDLKIHLLKKGHAYFIFSTLSPRSKLEKYLKKEAYSYDIIARRKFEGEELHLYRVTPTD
jgi:release factor glutamine methyltransferase